MIIIYFLISHDTIALLPSSMVTRQKPCARKEKFSIKKVQSMPVHHYNDFLPVASAAVVAIVVGGNSDVFWC